jgi:hypothetical protein
VVIKTDKPVPEVQKEVAHLYKDLLKRSADEGGARIRAETQKKARTEGALCRALL